jgi:ketopantoate hydroxymethyltransferase
MIYHASSVVRAIERALVVVDYLLEVTNQTLKRAFAPSIMKKAVDMP